MGPKPFAFVLMPFSENFDDIYRLGIQAAAVESGILAERVDEQVYSETMLERIYRQIDIADFIIADLTGKNPNVFYEIGYAHAKQKRCTLLTQRADDIPFDLKHHRHLVYGSKISALKSMLITEMEWHKLEIERKKSNVFTVSLKSIESTLVKDEYRANTDITLKLDIHNYTEHRTPEIEAIYLHSGTGWTYYQNGEPCPQTESTSEGKSTRHFVKSPVIRLSPGAWAQISIRGEKRVWSKFSSKEDVKEKYPLKGFLKIEFITSEGTFIQKINIETVAEEFPF